MTEMVSQPPAWLWTNCLRIVFRSSFSNSPSFIRLIFSKTKSMFLHDWGAITFHLQTRTFLRVKYSTIRNDARMTGVPGLFWVDMDMWWSLQERIVLACPLKFISCNSWPLFYQFRLHCMSFSVPFSQTLDKANVICPLRSNHYFSDSSPTFYFNLHLATLDSSLLEIPGSLLCRALAFSVPFAWNACLLEHVAALFPVGLYIASSSQWDLPSWSHQKSWPSPSLNFLCPYNALFPI